MKSLKELNKTFWKKYILNFTDNIFMGCRYIHEASYIGSGCPPIETKDGWLIIYHGVQDGPGGFIYHACAALIDRNDIRKEIGRLRKPLFSPTKSWEKKGIVSNVVFPSGTSLFEGKLYIYYGASDLHIAAASVNLGELIKELKKKSNRISE